MSGLHEYYSRDSHKGPKDPKKGLYRNVAKAGQSPSGYLLGTCDPLGYNLCSSYEDEGFP